MFPIGEGKTFSFHKPVVGILFPRPGGGVFGFVPLRGGGGAVSEGRGAGAGQRGTLRGGGASPPGTGTHTTRSAGNTF